MEQRRHRFHRLHNDSGMMAIVIISSTIGFIIVDIFFASAAISHRLSSCQWAGSGRAVGGQWVDSGWAGDNERLSICNPIDDHLYTIGLMIDTRSNCWRWSIIDHLPPFGQWHFRALIDNRWPLSISRRAKLSHSSSISIDPFIQERNELGRSIHRINTHTHTHIENIAHKYIENYKYMEKYIT